MAPFLNSGPSATSTSNSDPCMKNTMVSTDMVGLVGESLSRLAVSENQASRNTSSLYPDTKGKSLPPVKTCMQNLQGNGDYLLPSFSGTFNASSMNFAYFGGPAPNFQSGNSNLSSTDFLELSKGTETERGTFHQQRPSILSRSNYMNTFVSRPTRDDSIDIFLSQSPSQSLGSEFIKLRHGNSVDSLPSLFLDDKVSPITTSDRVFSSNEAKKVNHAFRHTYVNNVGIELGLDNTPPGSLTGTTVSSRSVSPSFNANIIDTNGRGAFLRTVKSDMSLHMRNRFTAESAPSAAVVSDHTDYSSVHNTFLPQQSHVASTAKYALPNSDIFQNKRLNHEECDQSFQYHSVGHQGTFSNVSHQTNQGISQDLSQQMFFVAIPTQDGRGQVLRPVQMIQIPGQPNTFVFPSAVPSNSGVTAHGFASPPDVQHISPVRFDDTKQLRPSHHFRNLSQFSLGDISVANGTKNYSHSADFFNTMNGHDGTHQYQGKDELSFAHHPINDTSLKSKDCLEPSYSADKMTESAFSLSQRLSLEEILGNVRQLSRDQVGCRIIQQFLDEEGATAASMVLNEGLSFWGEAMIDPFGNYLFQKLLEKITADERVILVKSISSRLVNASLNLHGTRSVQKIVELCVADETVSMKGSNFRSYSGSAVEILIQALAPAAARLCIDSHGNHVIQKILLKLPYIFSHFVFDAVAASVSDVARHRHGCCVIQRCLDSPPSAARSHLVRKIVEKSLDLMQDAYGNYVVQYVLDVCKDDDVHDICEAVVGKVTLLSIQKFSSNAMEKCFERCPDRIRALYIREICESDRIRELMMDPFGNYVIQRALAVSSHDQATKLVEAMKPHLVSGQGIGGIRNTAGGRRIMSKICKRFPNFALSANVGRSSRSNQLMDVPYVTEKDFISGPDVLPHTGEA